MSFPIETERLLIRPFTLDDAEEIQALWSDPETMRWIPSGPVATVEAARQKIERFMAHQVEHGFSLWPVREKATGRIVGDCGLVLVALTGPEVELAYRFGREFWGQGYATEAAGACLRHGFEQFGLKQIIAITSPDHIASRRVMEKNGLTYVGSETYYGREMVKYAIDRPVDPSPQPPPLRGEAETDSLPLAGGGPGRGS